MSLWKLLGLGGEPGPERRSEAGDTRTVRRIVQELEALDLQRARYLAAFAYVLSRVASADAHVSADETRKMEEIVTRFGHLPEEQAILVVQIAKNQNLLFGATEDFLVTRELKKLSTPEQRAEVLDCLFAVSAADDSISGVEEAQIRKIASELGFAHEEFVAARAAYSHKRDVMKDARGDD